MKLEILYRDDDLIIVNKPEHMIVHPGQGGNFERKNVLKLLRNQIDQWLFPIHRLDRPTSGVLCFGLNKDFAREIMQQWSSDKVEKYYLALSTKVYTEPNTFTFELSEEITQSRDLEVEQKVKVYKESITHYWPITTIEDRFTLLKCKIDTGRKHQIRRHFKNTGGHIAGDTKYGKGINNRYVREYFDLQRLFLHAYKMKIWHPRKEEFIEIKAELPESLQNALKNMKVPSEILNKVLTLDF